MLFDCVCLFDINEKCHHVVGYFHDALGNGQLECGAVTHVHDKFSLGQEREKVGVVCQDIEPADFVIA